MRGVFIRCVRFVVQRLPASEFVFVKCNDFLWVRGATGVIASRARFFGNLHRRVMLLREEPEGVEETGVEKN